MRPKCLPTWQSAGTCGSQWQERRGGGRRPWHSLQQKSTVLPQPPIRHVPRPSGWTPVLTSPHRPPAIPLVPRPQCGGRGHIRPGHSDTPVTATAVPPFGPLQITQLRTHIHKAFGWSAQALRNPAGAQQGLQWSFTWWGDWENRAEIDRVSRKGAEPYTRPSVENRRPLGCGTVWPDLHQPCGALGTCTHGDSGLT